MKLSPAMLEIMTFTHRVVGVQSSHLESAAAELFRRCERLQKELEDQMQQMTQLAEKLRDMSSREQEDGNGQVVRKPSPEERLQEAQERQGKLVARYEALRRKVGRASSVKRDLSTREVAWVEEIDALAINIGVVTEENEEPGTEQATSLDQRFDTVSSHVTP